MSDWSDIIQKCVFCGDYFDKEATVCPKCGRAMVKLSWKEDIAKPSEIAVSTLEALFIARLRQLAPDLAPYEREYRFDDKRQWRFDFAWPEQCCAVEIDGQEWTIGGHTSGTGMIRDREKQNAAVLQGWRILRFTSTQLKDNPQYCIDCVRDLLEMAVTKGYRP